MYLSTQKEEAKPIPVWLYPSTIEKLNTLSERLGLRRGVLMRLVIEAAVEDEMILEIIRKKLSKGEEK